MASGSRPSRWRAHTSRRRPEHGRVGVPPVRRRLAPADEAAVGLDRTTREAALHRRVRLAVAEATGGDRGDPLPESLVHHLTRASERAPASERPAAACVAGERNDGVMTWSFPSYRTGWPRARRSDGGTPACAAGRACAGAGSRSGRPRSIRPGRRRHHDDAVGEEHRLGDRVGDEQRGGGPLRPDPLQLEVEALAGHLVERAERLVEQQHLGLGDQRAGDRDALAHAAGQLRRPGLLEALEADELDEVGDRRVGATGDAGRPRAAGGCSLDRAPRQQRRVLEGDAEVVAAAGDRRAPRRAPAPPRRRRRRGRRGCAAPSTCRSPTGRAAR